MSARFPFCPISQIHTLSGGQKTLIGLSIILGLNEYKPSSLLLLDEADSHLDSSNARALSLYLKKTVGAQRIVITHRRETIEYGDAFIVVQKRDKEEGGIQVKEYKYREVAEGRVESEFLKVKGEAMKEEERQRKLEYMRL